MTAGAGREQRRRETRRRAIWSAVWPAPAFLLTLWVLLVAPVFGALLSLLLVHAALRRRRAERQGAQRRPWRILVAAALLTLALSLALIPGQRSLVEIVPGGTSTSTVPVEP